MSTRLVSRTGDNAAGRSLDPQWFDTAGAVQWFASRGFKTAPATLHKLRTVGGGPRFSKWGRRVVYSESALEEYRVARLSPEVSSTSALAG
jgi:hypothetical protein